MLLQVHDELVFEVPEDEVDKTLPVVKRVMEEAPMPALSLSVPLAGGRAGGAQLGRGALRKASWAERIRQLDIVVAPSSATAETGHRACCIGPFADGPIVTAPLR